MKLNELSDNKGARHARKRRGRGIGSGLGKTGGRGHKGQKSRSGVAIKGFEGGQMPIFRRVPKRGFSNPFRKIWAVVNLGTLQRALDDKKLAADAPITPDLLLDAGLVRRDLPVRLLGKGVLSTKVILEIAATSPAARAAVEAQGGEVRLQPFDHKKPAKEQPLQQGEEQKAMHWRKIKRASNQKDNQERKNKTASRRVVPKGVGDKVGKKAARKAALKGAALSSSASASSESAS